MSYSADDLIGKTLYAKANVPLRRLPQDDSPVIFTVKPGGTIGVVDTYVVRDGTVWWSFKDANKRNYYAQHKAGEFAEGPLKEQGLIDTQTKIKNEQRENEGIMPFIERNIKTIAIIAAVAVVVKAKILKG